MLGRGLGMRWTVAVAGLAAASTPGLAGGETMTFRAGCEGGQRITIAAVGDLLFHNSLQRQALARGGRYEDFWNTLAPVLAGADLTYGNLEGPAARGVAPGGQAVADPGRQWDGHVYGAPRDSLVFNYHPSLIDDLKQTGFDVVSTSNNHAADRGPLGIDRTIDALNAVGLKFSGTMRRGAEAFHRWAVTTQAGGLRVAWIACTYATNGMPDRHRQVLSCYGDRDKVFEEIRWNAQDPDVDAVILTPHWGIEKSPVPKASDRVYAREAIEAGASAVIGTHPHVLQGWEKIVAGDGRDGLVVYSTGNFISNQVSDDQRTGIVALVELTKTSTTRAEVSAAGFIPTWVERGGRHRVVEMRFGEQRKARAFPAALRRLPAGNYVVARDFRNMARTCPATAANDASPSGVR